MRVRLPMFEDDLRPVTSRRLPAPSEILALTRTSPFSLRRVR